MMKARNLPPDDELNALAQKVNAELPDAIRVDFHIVEVPAADGEVDRRAGMVMSCGAQRHSQMLPFKPTMDYWRDILRAVTEWSTAVIHRHRWVEDVDEADAQPWRD